MLERATEHGVEVGADGRVIGLMDVWHSCGNDPVRDHVARVGLAYLLMYTRKGEFTDPPQDPIDWPPDMMPYVIESRRSISKYGWRSGQYAWFQRYVEQAG